MLRKCKAVFRILILTDGSGVVKPLKLYKEKLCNTIQGTGETPEVH